MFELLVSFSVENEQIIYDRSLHVTPNALCVAQPCEILITTVSHVHAGSASNIYTVCFY